MKCILCRNAEATVPDRNTCSPRKRVCSECHGARLQGDLVRILGTDNLTALLQSRALLYLAIKEAWVRRLIWGEGVETPVGLLGRSPVADIAADYRQKYINLPFPDGDDKTLEFCRNRFNNLASFPSSPYVPENAVETGNPKGKP